MSWAEGQWKAVCDRCGFTYRSGELRVEPETRLRVCSRCFDPFPPANRPVIAPRESVIPWTRPASVSHEPMVLTVQDADGVFWAISADTDGVMTVSSTTGRSARRYVLFAASEYGPPLWALSVDTAGTPQVEAYDLATHGTGAAVSEWGVGVDTGYLLTIDDTGTPTLTAA